MVEQHISKQPHEIILIEPLPWYILIYLNPFSFLNNKFNYLFVQVIQSTMDSLHSVFSGSFLKGNGVVPTVKPEISSLHSSALLAWSLLLTVLSPPYIMDLVKT